MNKIIITIDGLSASGKSTVARRLAKMLGFVHLNSGALYRSVGVRAVEQGIPLDAEDEIVKLARSIQFCFRLDDENNSKLYVNGVPTGSEITTEQSGHYASTVSLLPKLREIITEVQRDTAKEVSVVLEGRDAGTVVFPDAPCKFFIDATVDERARRRLLELESHPAFQGKSLSFEQIRREIEERDYRDSNRTVAPTIKANDALLIDTTGVPIEDVVAKIASVVSAKLV